MSAAATAERVRFAPLGGPLITKGLAPLVMIAALGALAILARLIFGLGTVTALNDGYPWGLWIAFDVVIGTALACGGYSLALLIFVMNRGQYHPMIRAAVLTSAFGYSIAGLSVALDVGRYYLIWKVPLYFWSWNLNSVLLEVALCIMAYTVVLWLELAPAFLSTGAHSSNPRLRRLSLVTQPWLKRGLWLMIALGILLPTMHQSSLGSLMLLAGPRLHPLWNTPLLPLLFLVSCIGMGYAAVVMESTISARAFHRAPERRMLAGLGWVMVPVQVLYLVLRIGDLAYRGQLGALFALDTVSSVALVELALFVAAPLMLATASQRHDLGNLFRAAIVLAVSGAALRVNTFLVAFNPGANWSYFPSVGEILITAGLVALEILGYILIVRYFPILSGPALAKAAAGKPAVRSAPADALIASQS
jgi:Ni/Fe-hydrogenase subunit HybB-like protein